MADLIFTGVDVGHKNLKVLLYGQEESIVIPNIIGDASLYDVLETEEDRNPVNCLDISIKSNGEDLGRKYVGDLAIQMGFTERPLGMCKYNNNNILFAVLAGIAYALYEPEKPIKTVNIALGTCLPTREAIFKDKVKEHETRFIGTHKVKFHNEVFNGAEVTVKIHKIETISDGLAPLYDMVTDKKGNILPEYEYEDDKSIIFEYMFDIIVNIGWAITDIGAVDNFGLIPELNRSINKGIIHAEERIIQYLNFKDFDISIHDLDCYIREKRSNYILASNDKIIDIKGIKDVEFRRLSNALLNKVNTSIEIMPSNLLSHINQIVVTGGGAILLKEYIEDRIGNYKIVISKTPLEDTVRGCLKTAMQLGS